MAVLILAFFASLSTDKFGLTGVHEKKKSSKKKSVLGHRKSDELTEEKKPLIKKKSKDSKGKNIH